MKVRRWSFGAGLGALVAAASVAGLGGARPNTDAMFAGTGGLAVAVAAGAAWHFRQRGVATEPSPERQPRLPVRAAQVPRKQTDLEGVVAEFAGPAATAHALRCVALVDLLRDHLALRPEEADHLSMAAALHVLPAAFPASEDASAANCDFEPGAVHAAEAKLRRLAPEDAVRMATEVCERWDGTGRPNRLAGEQSSLGGRILAAVCRFDHASSNGLEAGLDVLREGNGTAFDPVVVAEIIHLFKQPWQQQIAA